MVSPVLAHGDTTFEEQHNQTPLVSQISQPARSKMPWAEFRRSHIGSAFMDSLEGPSTSVANKQPALLVVNVGEGHEGIFQHRDAGPLGFEIPPPYPERDSGGSRTQ